jgi:hypothetical protein
MHPEEPPIADVVCSNILGVPVDSWETGTPKHWGTYKFAVMQTTSFAVHLHLMTVKPSSLNGGPGTSTCDFSSATWDEVDLAYETVKFIGPLDEDEYWLMKWALDPYGGYFLKSLNELCE